MFNQTNNIDCECHDYGYYIAGITSILALMSEILPFCKKIKANGIVHVFTSQCFKKKKYETEAEV